MSEHHSPIKTPQQLIVAVVLGFVIPVAVIVLLTKFIAAEPRTGAGSNQMTPEAIAERISPVGRVSTEPPVGAAPVQVAAVSAVARGGQEVYTAKCAGCHAAGVVGSPKFGDLAAWAPRIAQGYDALLASAINGKGAMGGQVGGGYSEEEIANAVKYLANSAGGNF